jgi:hypothetical protein
MKRAQDDDPGFEYDDVIAEAKRMGIDPFDREGEYKPAAVEAAMASLARQERDA